MDSRLEALPIRFKPKLCGGVASKHRRLDTPSVRGALRVVHMIITDHASEQIRDLLEPRSILRTPCPSLIAHRSNPLSK